MTAAPGQDRHRVYAIVVSYRCDLDRLAPQFARLLGQVECIVWVDNGPGPPNPEWLSQWPRDRLDTVWLNANHGIGYAQNRGIERALSHGATHILLMDDDSLPAPDMVQHLLEALVTGAGPQLAAVGPFYVDPRRAQPRSPFFRIAGARVHRLGPHAAGKGVEVDYLIASGMLIPRTVLQHVGPMREDYFIDWVDVEWCFRARRLGYALHGVFDARMEHRLGGAIVRIAGHEVALHPPWRHYYQVRNLLLLLRQPHLPGRMRWGMAIRQVQRLGAIWLSAPQRLAYVRAWVRGIRDGLLGKSGGPPLEGDGQGYRDRLDAGRE